MHLSEACYPFKIRRLTLIFAIELATGTWAPLAAAVPLKNCDLAGKDLRSAPQLTPEACEADCAATGNCRGWVFVSGWNRCFLKSLVRRTVPLTLHGGQVSSTDEGARQIKAYTANSDHRGKDLRRVSGMKTTESCGQACLAEVACRGIVFMEGYGDCWLKKTVGNLSPKIFFCGQRPAKLMPGAKDAEESK